MCEMRKRLEELFKFAKSQEVKAKRKAKDLCDLNTQPRQLEPGELVLCHTPGLTSKLHSFWEGSFEELAKMSECNYVIPGPGKGYTKQTVHINRLKKWVEPKANLFRGVVADEEIQEPVGKVRLGVPHLSEAQQSELGDVLAEYPDRVTTELGLAKNEIAEILVKDCYPIRSPPYRIAPGMVKQLREEIEGLIRKDIIVPSKSPWTSPMVPVRKKGADRICLCIDYRRLNEVTINDPFQMPCIEDLLNQVAGATWLSKLDLNKGFYQVPLSTHSQEKTAFCFPWENLHRGLLHFPPKFAHFFLPVITFFSFLLCK